MIWLLLNKRLSLSVRLTDFRFSVSQPSLKKTRPCDRLESIGEIQSMFHVAAFIYVFMNRFLTLSLDRFRCHLRYHP